MKIDIVKEIKDIVKEIEEFGVCFIGTAEVQGFTYFRRFELVQREWRKNHETILVFDLDTGICWEILH